jgi:pimeloyl-ACP methyl ester carboxylesterase
MTVSESPAPRAVGPGSRPWPVVLVHGTRTSHSQWDLQTPSLRAAGHHVLTPDLPGHGTDRGAPFSLETAETVIEDAVRDAHAATGRPVHLVGSSLGGMLAIHSASRLSAQPRPVLGSVIACGAAVQPTPGAARLYARLMTAGDLLPSMRSGTAAFPFTWLLGHVGARAYLRGGRADADVIAPAFAAVASLDLRAELARIPVPVTFLHGRGDQLRLHERSFAAAAPQGWLELLPYGNHMVNLVRPERFTADLLRLLARTEQASPAPGQSPSTARAMRK